MNEDIASALAENLRKTGNALRLLTASLDDYRPYDPAAALSPKQLEPYDALADRYVRTVECALRLFRSVEMYEFAEVSPSTRSTLGRMEKRGWDSGTEIWLAMRAICNRLVDDDLPDQTVQMFCTVTGEFAQALRRLRGKVGS